MSKNYGRAKNRQQGKPGPPVQPVVNKIQQWSRTICAQASGKGTLAGLHALGPINSPRDLLLPMANASDPQGMLAAEQIIHLVEGCRYVAAATSAYMSHANAATTHFAYYAELRAAMSLFAWSGIRLKWGSYCYLDKNGKKQVPSALNPGTHAAVWGLWPEWVARADVQNLLINSIKLHPLVSLDKVIGAINFTQPRHVLKGWGADFVRISDDHKARNDASYEATWLNSPLTQMLEEEATLVRDLWRLFLADGNGLGFDAAFCSHFVEAAVSRERPIDSHLPTTPEGIRQKIAKHISINTGAPEAEVLRRLDPGQYPSRPFSLAAAADAKAGNVLCRSFLLLRIALLAMKSNLSTPGIPATGTTWLKNWLKHAGLWSASTGTDPLDLEVDYREAVLELDVVCPLPSSLWSGDNLIRFPLVARPDACIAWSLVA
jgi:hypothetical protein